MRCPKCGHEHLMNSGKAGSGRARYQCPKCQHRTTNPNRAVGETLPGPVKLDPLVEFKDRLPKARRYVITAAQNATPIHKPFFAALKHYCKARDAELIVIPFRYRNPTSAWTADNESNEWWVPDVVPHLYDGRFNLNNKLTVLADIKVQPTAVSPLTGLESITGERTGIIGHPKVQLATIATPSHKMPKIMTTTGALTVKNYTDTKAGKKGEFHHTFGACVVELSGSKFHMRQISACEDGSFIDLDITATADGVKKAPPALALIMGDTHVKFVDPAVVKATFTAKGSIVKALKPQKLVWHDLLEFYAQNHHHRNDPFMSVAKRKTGDDNIRQEVAEACAFVNKHTPKGVESVLVPSNHTSALGRYIKETDWRYDPENAAFYLETALHMAQQTRMGPGGVETPDPFLFWAGRLITADCRLLKDGEPYAVADVELSMHGHEGPNGARGSIKSFARIGVKSTTGHGHSPAIEEGHHRTGTSTSLRLAYQGGGPSSWLQTHDVIYANGKRSLINIIEGEWRA